MSKPKTISKTLLPVWVLLMVRTLDEFTVSDAIDEFQVRHQVELDFTRMNQILNDLVADELLEKTQKEKGARKKMTAHYKFILLPDGESKSHQQQRSA